MTLDYDSVVEFAKEIEQSTPESGVGMYCKLYYRNRTPLIDRIMGWIHRKPLSVSETTSMILSPLNHEIISQGDILTSDQAARSVGSETISQNAGS